MNHQKLGKDGINEQTWLYVGTLEDVQRGQDFLHFKVFFLNNKEELMA